MATVGDASRADSPAKCSEYKKEREKAADSLNKEEATFGSSEAF
jgi:hypothetical protein